MHDLKVAVCVLTLFLHHLFYTAEIISLSLTHLVFDKHYQNCT